MAREFLARIAAAVRKAKDGSLQVAGSVTGKILHSAKTSRDKILHVPERALRVVRGLPAAVAGTFKRIYAPAPDEAAARRSGRRSGLLQLGAMGIFAGTAAFLIGAPAVTPAAMGLAITVGVIGLPVAVAGFVLGVLQEERAGPVAWGGAFVPPEKRAEEPRRLPPARTALKSFNDVTPAPAAGEEQAAVTPQPKQEMPKP